MGIAKSNYFFFALITGFYNKLLPARNLTFGLVALHFGLVDLCH